MLLGMDNWISAHAADALSDAIVDLLNLRLMADPAPCAVEIFLGQVLALKATLRTAPKQVMPDALMVLCLAVDSVLDELKGHTRCGYPFPLLSARPREYCVLAVAHKGCHKAASGAELAPKVNGQLAERCERFNERYPVGTAMNYHPVIGEQAKVVVRVTSAAYVLSGHTPVCFVEGVSGCVALDALTEADC